jgi:hypothetical protein
MQTHYVVAVYDVSRQYGGPEEGGWWYSDGPLLGIENVFANEQDADHRAYDLNEEFQAEAESLDRKVATVVELPRTVPDRPRCHNDEWEDVVRWDIPTSYRDDYAPHYC